MLRAVTKSAKEILRKCCNAAGEQSEIYSTGKVCYDKILCVVLKMARHTLISVIASHITRYKIANVFLFKYVNLSEFL